MPPEGITSHFDSYCSYVLNTTFIFPSDVIYLGGCIKNYLEVVYQLTIFTYFKHGYE